MPAQHSQRSPRASRRDRQRETDRQKDRNRVRGRGGEREKQEGGGVLFCADLVDVDLCDVRASDVLK